MGANKQSEFCKFLLTHFAENRASTVNDVRILM